MRFCEEVPREIGGNAVYENILTRVSVRDFTDEGVGEGEVPLCCVPPWLRRRV